MKMVSHFVSALALLISVVAAVIALVGMENQRSEGPVAAATPVEKTLESEEIEKFVAKTVKEELNRQLKLKKNGKGELEAKLKGLMKNQMVHLGPALKSVIQNEIKKLVLERLRDELDKIDWGDTIDQDKVKKILAKSIKRNGNSHFSQDKRIDVSDLDSNEEKIKKILEEFEGVNSYSHNNALVKQLVEMGEDAIEPLLALLPKDKAHVHGEWAKNMAITDALQGLLNEGHKDIILEEFKDNTRFAKTIKKYKFPEAEELVMNKLSDSGDSPFTQISSEVVDLALYYDEEKALPLLVDRLGKGGYDAGHIAKRLSTYPELDIDAELISAARKCQSPWQSSQLVPIMLEKGLPEAFENAIDVLSSKQKHSEHAKEQIANAIRKYTYATGNYKEMADWLQKNKDLEWNEQTRRFE